MTFSRNILVVLLCLCNLVLVSALAAEGQRTLTPWDLARIQSMTTAKISPDGETIAAVRAVPRALFIEPDGKDWAELYLLDAAGGLARPFVTGEVNVSDVDWHPDGTAVSYIAKRGEDEHAGLYLIPTTGGESSVIVALETAIKNYSWHPDGSRVAVIAAEAKTEEERDLEDQGFDQEIFEEDSKPDRVWIADPEGATEPRPLDLKGSAVQVRWSPGGDRLAVAVAPRPLVDDRLMFQTIHIVSAATGEIEATVEREGKLDRIDWSPDGTHLAMISAIDGHDPSASSLLVVPASGGEPRNLTLDFEGSVSAFAWRSNNSLMLLADVGVRTEIYRLGLDKGEMKAMGRLNDGVVYTSLSVAADGRRMALLGNSASHPDEVFVADIVYATTPVRLTEANPWLEEIRLGSQEVVRHRVRDGLELEGVLIRPIAHPDGRPAPLVMVVHGGPEGHRRDGWLNRYSSPAQVLAARGYAVFFPNYRGSTGRGVAFSKLGQADAAGAEFDDLVDAVDHLIEIGVADADRVGVTGGSYGGYATAWLATRYSERFAAGVMFVGISNKISKFGTTDISKEETMVHALGLPWDNWDFFRERSPLTYAEDCRTPMLIMGGADDPRVSPTQSMEFYRALKTMGKTPVRLVRYPGEGHGNRRAASRFDYQLRLLRWFDRYLMGAGGELPPMRIDHKSPAAGWTPEEL